MMRNVMIAVAAMAMVGCGDVPAGGEMDQIDEVTKADGTYPIGNFDGSVKLGQIRDLTLNSDKTYSYFVQVVDCIPGGCQPVTGTYKFSHSSTTKYLRFYDADGNFDVRYAYKFDGSKLSLKKDGTTTWFALTKTDLATYGESCGGFTRSPKSCADGLKCVFKGVPDVPGTCQHDDSNPCEQAGGSCVALAPGSCSGEVGDARQYSCGGGLGVECCFPASDGASCNADKDCSGILPQFCKVCSDGSTSCAHWACQAHHCAVTTCN
jgi:hypothetical protein